MPSIHVFRLTQQPAYTTSQIIESVLHQDHATFDAFTRFILPKLADYLRATVRAAPSMAEECAQQALTNVYERILAGHFESDVNIVGYLMTSSRNEYFRLLRRETREGGAALEEQLMVSPAEQYQELVDAERERILTECLQQLDEASRGFIEFYMSRPDASYLVVSREFNLSPANVRVRKSRILQRLHECFRRKDAS